MSLYSASRSGRRLFSSAAIFPEPAAPVLAVDEGLTVFFFDVEEPLDALFLFTLILHFLLSATTAHDLPASEAIWGGICVALNYLSQTDFFSAVPLAAAPGAKTVIIPCSQTSTRGGE